METKSSSESPILVHKYGGTSVGSIERIRVVARHIAGLAASGHRLIIVPSAMGDHTDRLLDMAYLLSPSPPRREVDMLLSTGERVSMALLSISLHELGIKSISFTGSQVGIITDDAHGNARIKSVLGHRVRQAFGGHQVVIVAGFQGVSAEGKEITTLGRGGSDLTALALAKAFDAEICEIYTDVNGVCAADPRILPSAHCLPHISWEVMNEMAWYGAGVLQTRAAHLAAKFKIPFRIRSSFDFTNTGTTIGEVKAMESPIVSAIAHKENLGLLQVSQATNKPLLDAAMTWLWQQGEHALVANETMIENSHVLSSLVTAQKCIEGLLANLQESHQNLKVINLRQDVASVTLVGEGFWLSPELISKVRRITHVFNPYFFETKNTAITAIVSGEKVSSLVGALYENFLNKT